jgi:hypothetical protein
MVITLEAFFCSKKYSYVKQFVDSPGIGRVYVFEDKRILVNKPTLIDVAQVVNVNLEIITDIGTKAYVWTNN